MFKKFLAKLSSFIPDNRGEYVTWSIDPDTCRSKLYYSSKEAFYKHYKRQFDAAARLAKILNKRELK